jgi:hypothetical protein
LENSTKKKWQKPEVMILGQNNVNGGAQPGYHENSISTSHPTNLNGFQFHFLLDSGTDVLAHHPKTFYVS